MNWFLLALQRSWAFLLQYFQPRYVAEIVQEELPSIVLKSRLYIVEESGYLERAALLCPCGCRKVLYLNLLSDERPCWEIDIHRDNTASLKPSVWRKTGCRSHFWLHHGRIVWCE